MAVVRSGGRLWRALLTGLAGLGRAGSGRPRSDAGVVRVVDIVLTLIVMLALTGADRTDVRTLPDLSGQYVCNSVIAPGSTQQCRCLHLFCSFRSLEADFCFIYPKLETFYETSYETFCETVYEFHYNLDSQTYKHYNKNFEHKQAPNFKAFHQRRIIQQNVSTKIMVLERNGQYNIIKATRQQMSRINRKGQSADPKRKYTRTIRLHIERKRQKFRAITNQKGRTDQQHYLQLVRFNIDTRRAADRDMNKRRHPDAEKTDRTMRTKKSYIWRTRWI